MTLNTVGCAAPAGAPVVAAAGGRGRNSSDRLDNREFAPTLPGNDESVAKVGVHDAISRQLRARADAARRLPGGDPWTTRPSEEESPSPTVWLAAWAAASADLSGTGYTPIVPAAVARRLWRLGGVERERMEWLHRAGGISG